MKNRELKVKLLENGTSKAFNKKRWDLKCLGKYDELDKINSYVNDKTGEMILNDDEELKECKRLCHNQAKQKNNIFKQISYYYQRINLYDIYFFTFTYDDSKRRKPMNCETFRKFIHRYCLDNDIVKDFSLNVDYGHDNGRLHYHAVIMLPKGTRANLERHKDKKGHFHDFAKFDFMNDYESHIGFYSALKINDEYGVKKISEYMKKLTTHSIKVKQTYISVKKGSPYQKYKQAKKREQAELKTSTKYSRSVGIQDYINAIESTKDILGYENIIDDLVPLWEQNIKQKKQFKQELEEKKRRINDNSILFDITN